MNVPIGDMTLNILLRVEEAEKGAKHYTATLKNVEEIQSKVKSSVVDLSDKTAKLGFVLNSVKEVGYALNSSLRTIFNTIQASNDAYQQYLNSNRQLEATSKLTGASLKDLKNISEETKKQFSLSTDQSNLFTIELTKLGQKAGDVSKVQQSINALMDLGAGQGLSSEQTLYAIKQAILGIDEGTDKLFQKNPSVLYAEFAKNIGTTAGKLTDQEKAQALLDAVINNGEILRGNYSQYLDSAAGKQQTLNNKINDAKIKLGEELQPVMLSVLGTVNDSFKAFSSLSGGMQTFIIAIGTITVAVINLLPLLGTLVATFPAVGVAARAAAAAIASAFSTTGPVGLALAAIALLLWEIWDLYQKISGKSVREPSPSSNKTVGDSDTLKGKDSSLDNYFKTKEEKDKNKNEFFTKEEQEKTKVEIKKDQDKLKLPTVGNNKGGKTAKTEKDIETIIDFTNRLQINLSALAEKIRGADRAGNTGRRGLQSAEPSKGFNLSALSEKVQNVKAEEPEDKLEKGFQQSIAFAQQLSNVLGIGADTFTGKLLSGLQEGLSLANSFMSLLSAVFNVGSGGIFSLLGLASGGLVPGSGTGDTVPAMLTPGEFVVKQSRVSQLGTGFLTWLNGGGLFNSMAGHYASGGMVTASGSGGVQVVVLDSRIKGSDIVLSQARTNKIDKRRTIL